MFVNEGIDKNNNTKDKQVKTIVDLENKIYRNTLHRFEEIYVTLITTIELIVEGELLMFLSLWHHYIFLKLDHFSI